MLNVKLRVIGDVHGQVDSELEDRHQSYLQIISSCPYSVQVGDMGRDETYEILKARVDPRCHRFFAGNHDDYRLLPPHSLGDFGEAMLGGVRFFFIRGAESIDKMKLISVGKEFGTQLWFEQEELTPKEMDEAACAYASCRPAIVLSHEAPDHIARFAYENAGRYRRRIPGEYYCSSRTALFLDRLLEMHQPCLWVFGHHHRDWSYREDRTLFVCVGELSYIDINAEGALVWQPLVHADAARNRECKRRRSERVMFAKD